MIASLRVVLAALAFATDWSFAWEAAAGLALLLTTTLALADLTARAAPARASWPVPTTVALTAWLLCSPA